MEDKEIYKHPKTGREISNIAYFHLVGKEPYVLPQQNIQQDIRTIESDSLDSKNFN